MNTTLMVTDRRLPGRFKDKDYRTAFVDANISNTIAAQLFALRKKMNWSQARLARAAGMAQARISLLESSDYGNFTITTLKRLAAAFDVALIVRFASFGEVVAENDRISPDTIGVPSFDEETESLQQPFQITPPQYLPADWVLPQGQISLYQQGSIEKNLGIETTRPLENNLAAFIVSHGQATRPGQATTPQLESWT